MSYKRKTNRPYRKVTVATIAKHEAKSIELGSGARAVEALEPDEKEARQRAWLINNKKRQLDVGEYVDSQLQQIATEAVERVGTMVQSADERIATKNAHFVIDHVRGKALQRSETKHLNLNIEAVLE